MGSVIDSVSANTNLYGKPNLARTVAQMEQKHCPQRNPLMNRNSTLSMSGFDWAWRLSSCKAPVSSHQSKHKDWMTRPQIEEDCLQNSIECDPSIRT